MLASAADPVIIHPSALGQRTFRSELGILLVMARKEWTIFRRYPSSIVAFLIWPIIFPFSAIFTARALSGPDNSSLPAFALRAGTTDYAAYIVIGLTIYMWINITLWDIGFHLRNEQMRGTLESNWLCPVWRFSILLGPSLSKLGTSLFFFVLAAIEYQLLFGISLVGERPGLVLLILLLTIPSIYGIGVAFGSLVIRFQEANALVFLVRGIFLIFTGASYPLTVLPDWMQRVAAWLPLTYTITAIRAVALNDAGLADILPALAMLLLFAAILLPAAYLLFRFTEQRARRTGTLGQY
ncbi:MAG TPA: ABC transporter permease [Caldilineaceae bacterium]|nr:ABC transporter permease [Caldilineaceae bacterium]